jgi:hypothetical protein
MSNRVLTIIFCLGLPTIVMLVFAVIGTKYRVKLVNHISQKMKSGSYDEIAAGKNNNKIRVFTAIGLIDIVLLGLLIILIV